MARHTIERDSFSAYLNRMFSPVFDVHDKHQVHVSHGRGRWGAPIKHALFLLTPLRRATGFAFPKSILPKSTAGNWLEEVLLQAGVDPKVDVWITNCVKHWISPDIQSSLSSTTPEERFELFDNGLHGGKTKLLNLLAREQRDVIMKEIAAVNPRIVILVGGTALKVVEGKRIDAVIKLSKAIKPVTLERLNPLLPTMETRLGIDMPAAVTRRLKSMRTGLMTESPQVAIMRLRSWWI
ncbi:hypothetical protein WJX82_007200 [Trebouxia sp. C0006]